MVQSDEGEGYRADEYWAYGGIGYGGDLSPDLSNTQFAMEAMKRGGVPSDDESFRKAMSFLQRCQNDPEINPKVIVRGDGRKVQAGTDGGGIADVIGNLINQPDRMLKMSARSREIAEFHYRWDRVAERTLAVYRKLLRDAVK